MLTKKELEVVHDVITDKIAALRGYATNKNTANSEIHGTIVKIEHLTSALTKIEMMGEK